VISDLVGEALPASPMLLAVIGFPPDEQRDVLALAPPSSTVADLDEVDPGAPLDDPASGVVAVVARTYTDLRRVASLATLLPKAAHVVIAVATGPADRPVAVPVVSPDRHGVLSLQARRGPAGDWSVEGRFARPRPVGEFIVALIRGLGGNPLVATPGPRVALAGAGASHWRPGDPAATPITMGGPLGDPDGPPPADLVLRVTGPDPVPWTDPRVGAVIDRPPFDRLAWAGTADGWNGAAPPGTGRNGGARPDTGLPAEADAVPPVDEWSVNPVGFAGTPGSASGTLTSVGDHWSVQVDPAASPVRFHPSGAVTDADVARLRQLRSVRIDWGREGDSIDPIAAVRVIAGLAAAGVPLHSAPAPSWAGALGTGLTELITTAGEDDLADDLRREEHSVRLRRVALRTHSARARWRDLAGAAGVVVPRPPKISVILCTRRPEFLGFALEQIGRQRHVDLELVLTLHGIPADLPEVKAAVADFDRPVTVIEVPVDVPFGEALNHGVARASGRYVAKWDDDDWYSPEFLADMTLASSYTGAELVGCHAQFVYLAQIDLTIYRPARSEFMSRSISGGTFVMERSTLDSVGGFPSVSRHVDAALLDSLSAAGARIYRTHSLGYALHRRATGHTWNQPVTYFLRRATLQWRGLRFSAFIDPAASPLPLLSNVSVPR